jgi:hypothetical protein
MTPNQNPQSTKRFAVIGYTGSKRSRAICLTWHVHFALAKGKSLSQWGAAI